MFGTSIGRRFAVLSSTIRIWFWDAPVFVLPQIDLHLMSRPRCGSKTRPCLKMGVRDSRDEQRRSVAALQVQFWPKYCA
jgi:hypothetical protein